MKLKRIAILAIVACLAWGGTAIAQTPTPISNTSDLEDNSTILDNTYVLDPDSYTVNSAIDIQFDINENIAVNNSVSLEIDAAANNVGGYLFAANKVAVDGGKLTVTGGENTGGLFTASDISIANGIINATGGTNTGIYGVITLSNFYVSDEAEVIARGGAADNASGIYVGIDFTTIGSVSAIGGTGHSAYGLDVNDSFIAYEKAEVMAQGGGGENAAGIHVGKDLIANCIITATGGNGIGAFGVITGGSFYASDEAAITAQGGEGQDAVGIYAGQEFAAIDSVINATGGKGEGAYGIYVNGSFIAYQELGTIAITAQGGEGKNAVGIYTEKDFIFSDGEITAQGGSDVGAVGINVNQTLNIQGGTVNASAGSNYQTAGIVAKTVDITDCTVTAQGGEYAAGMEVAAGFTQFGGAVITKGGDMAGIYIEQGGYKITDGTLNATGGDGIGAFGVYTGDDFYVSDDADVIAQGGEGQDAAGIYVGKDFTTISYTTATGGNGKDACGIHVNGSFIAYEEAEVTAQGGAGDDAYGIYVKNTAWIGKNIFVAKDNTAAAIYVANSANDDTAIVFGNNTDLSIGVDLLFPGALIVAEQGDISISNTTTMEVDYMLNTAVVTTGKNVSAVVAETRDGIVDVESGFVNPEGDTLTIKWSGAVNADGDAYELTVERIANPSQFVNGPNTQKWLDGVGAGLAVILENSAATGAELNPVAEFFNGMYSYFDKALSAEMINDTANFMQLYSTPHATTRLAGFSMQQVDAVQSAFNAGLDSYDKMNYWQLWATPIVFGGDADADTHEFDDYKERFWGGVIGLGKDFNDKVTVALQFHYLDGSVKSDRYKAEGDTWGVTAGARFHDFAGSQRWNPWADLSLTYSNQCFDQKRDGFAIYGPAELKSDVDSDLFRLNVAFGNDFAIYSNVFLTPVIGLEYTHIRQDSYTEKGSLFALHVGKENFDSLRPKLGLNLKANLSDNFALNAYAFYRYEMMDKRVSLNSHYVNAPEIAFTTKGEDLSRHSGNFGMGMDWQIVPEVSLGLNYDLWVKEHYMGHMGSLKLSFGF